MNYLKIAIGTGILFLSGVTAISFMANKVLKKNIEIVELKADLTLTRDSLQNCRDSLNQAEKAAVEITNYYFNGKAKNLNFKK